MDRRNFLKKASKTAAGLVFFSGKLCAVARQQFRPPHIPLNIPSLNIPSLNIPSNKPEPGLYELDDDDFDKYDFVMPRVQVSPLKVAGRGESSDLWNVRPGGDKNLLTRLSSVIRCKTKPILNVKSGWDPMYAQKKGQLNGVVTFDEPEKLRKYPFLFMTDENEFRFTQIQKNNLREYIRRGGFLFMDDCVVGNGGDFFYRSAYNLLEDVFGRNSVKTIPREHEIFHNVYDLGEIGLPYMQGQNHGARGVYNGNRLAIFLSSNDIHCGWCDAEHGSFGPMGHEYALQMGVNIIMYAMSH